MKKLLLHIILLSYTVVIFKPVLPYVADVIGHVFFYAHHMATVHYENGKYHVHYDIAQINKEEQSDKSTVPNFKKDNFSSEHIISVCSIPDLSLKVFFNKNKFSNTPAVTTGIVRHNYPPPKV